MFARTDRLLLRPGWPDDAAALADAIGEERIVRNLVTAPWPYTLADAQAYLGRPMAALPSFLILERTAGRPRLTGGIGFARDARGDVELGYWIRGDRWGLGYATETGHAALAIARDALRLCRVTSGHFIDNPASGRVLEKLGFAATGDLVARQSAARGEAALTREMALRLCAAGCPCGEPERMAA